jgi:hypothetical protein
MIFKIDELKKVMQTTKPQYDMNKHNETKN